MVTRSAPKTAKPPGRRWLFFGQKHGRVRTPTILQMEAAECGAASLGIVLAYYGRRVSLEELRLACGVSRDGSRAKHVLIAARKYGCKAQGFRKSIDKLKELRFPVIVFWNFNHFVVVEGFGRNQVYINDPARGPRVVTADEFDAAFTGVTLTVEPGPEFQRGGRPPSLLGGLARRLKGSRLAVGYLLAVGIGLTLLGFVGPAFSRVFIDRVLVGGITPWAVPLLVIMLAAAALLWGLTWLQQHYLLRLETKLAASTTAQFFWHVLRLPLEFYQQRLAADISVRVGSNDQIAQLLSGEVATNLLNLVLIVFYLVVMLRYDAVLTFVAVGLALLNLVALRFVSRRRVDASQRLLNEQGKLFSTAYNGLQMIETLKATGGESDFFARWAGYQAKSVNAEQELAFATEMLAAVPPAILALNSAALLTIGGLRILAGRLTVGELVAFQALSLAFLLPINWLVNLGGRLQQTTGVMARLDDVYRYPLDPEALPAGPSPASGGAKLSGAIELRKVTFGYSRLDDPLIEDFSLTVQPGARLALVGGSGSGKSTIAKLVAGLYEPWSGEILFDGLPRQAVPRGRMKSSLAMVDQDIYLIEGSIRQNMTMWDTTIPEATLVQAAKDANVHTEIAARSGGYDSQVSEGGANFSGGQRQRLEIARALVGDPTLLIMDEATSALDPTSEKIIDDNLRRRGCTCLIVAHRLSTIRDADEIIVLEKGKVVQRGTHAQMMKAGGPYARLLETSEFKPAESGSILDRL